MLRVELLHPVTGVDGREPVVLSYVAFGRTAVECLANLEREISALTGEFSFADDPAFNACACLATVNGDGGADLFYRRQDYDTPEDNYTISSRLATAEELAELNQGEPKPVESDSTGIVRELIDALEHVLDASEDSGDMNDIGWDYLRSVLNKAKGEPKLIPSEFVGIVTVNDPVTKNPVDVEIRQLETGAMIGIDGSYLERDVGPVYSPYDPGCEVGIPDDESPLERAAVAAVKESMRGE